MRRLGIRTPIGYFKLVFSLFVLLVCVLLVRSPPGSEYATFPHAAPSCESCGPPIHIPRAAEKRNLDKKASELSEMTTVAAAIMDAFEQEVSRVPARSELRVAIGYNANLDLVVSGTELLHNLDVRPSGQTVDHEILGSFVELEQTFAVYFAASSAAERFFSDRTLFGRVSEVGLALPDASVHIGGNAAIMAEKLAAEGLPVLLGGPVGPKLKALLSSDLATSSPADDDEVHLIAEFDKGEKWGELECESRSNRFIFSSDIANGELRLVEAFHNALAVFHPSVVVIAGLHLLSGQRQELIDERLQVVGAELSRISIDTPIHWELASVAESKLLAHIASVVAPRVDSLGLNEQELKGLVAALKGSMGVLPEDGVPEPGAVAEELAFVLERFGKAAGGRLSRIQFHCLGFHLVACAAASEWSVTGARASVAQASLTAARRAADVEALEPAMVMLRFPESFEVGGVKRKLIESDPFTCWHANGVDFTLAPSLLAKRVVRTVGLGDCISSMGLLYHL